MSDSNHVMKITIPWLAAWLSLLGGCVSAGYIYTKRYIRAVLALTIYWFLFYYYNQLQTDLMKVVLGLFVMIITVDTYFVARRLEAQQIKELKKRIEAANALGQNKPDHDQLLEIVNFAIEFAKECGVYESAIRDFLINNISKDHSIEGKKLNEIAIDIFDYYLGYPDNIESGKWALLRSIFWNSNIGFNLDWKTSLDEVVYFCDKSTQTYNLNISSVDEGENIAVTIGEETIRLPKEKLYPDLSREQYVDIEHKRIEANVLVFAINASLKKYSLEFYTTDEDGDSFDFILLKNDVYENLVNRYGDVVVNHLMPLASFLKENR